MHFQQHDPFNVMLTVRALQVGTACFTGDFDGTMATLDRLHAWSQSHGPLPVQRVPVRRAEGWALRMRNTAEAGRQLLEDAASLREMAAIGALRYAVEAASDAATAYVAAGRRTPLDERRPAPGTCTSPIRAPSSPGSTVSTPPRSS